MISVLYLRYGQNFQPAAFILIGISFALIIILVWKNRGLFGSCFKNISWRSEILLTILIMFFSFLVAFSGFNFKTFIPSDTEWESLLEAKQIIHGEQIFTHTRYGLIYPLVLSIGFRTFGFTPLVASILNFIFGVLSIILIFAIAQIIFQNEIISLISSYIYAFTPLVFVFTAFEMGFPAIVTFFLLLFSLTALLYFKYHTLSLLFLSLLLIIIISQIKPEYFIISIPFIICFILFKDYKKLPLKSLLVILAICFILSLPYIIKVISLKSSYSDNWCGFISQTNSSNVLSVPKSALVQYLDRILKFVLNNRFSLVYFVYDIPNFVKFWALTSFALVSILILIGIIANFNKVFKKSLFLILLFIFISFVYLSDCAYYESRYAIPTYSLIVCFGGFGIYFISNSVSRKPRYKYITIILIITLLFVYWYNTNYRTYILKSSYKDHFHTRHVQDEYQRLVATVKDIDKNTSSILVVHSNEMLILQFLDYDASSLVSIEEFNRFEKEKFDTIKLPFNPNKNNYFIESWYCDTLINLQAACNFIKNNYKITLVQQKNEDKIYLYSERN